MWPALTEAMHLLADTPHGVDTLCDMVSDQVLLLIELEAGDLARMKVPMQKYRDLPMDFADAALVRAAERDRITRIVTRPAFSRVPSAAPVAIRGLAFVNRTRERRTSNPRTLSRWPHHRPARQQMQVDVEHRLAGFAVAVEDRPVATLRVAVFPGQHGGRSEHRAHQRVIGRRQVIDGGNVPPRHDEQVQRRLRIDVLNRDQIVVLVDDGAFDLARDDLAEEAVAHGF